LGQIEIIILKKYSNHPVNTKNKNTETEPAKTSQKPVSPFLAPKEKATPDVRPQHLTAIRIHQPAPGKKWRFHRSTFSKIKLSSEKDIN
jgi:hypothetical protein